MLTSNSFFATESFAHATLFPANEMAWEPLKNLKRYMDGQEYPNLGNKLELGTPLPKTLVYFAGELRLGAGLRIEYNDPGKGRLLVYEGETLLPGASVLMAGAVFLGSGFSLGQGVLIESGAFIKGPLILGDRSEVRQGAYLRGYCLVGARCVVGHVTEVKHAIFLDDAKAGHFAYLGDSILGNQVNLGAGTKLANLRFTGGEVPIKTPGGLVASGLRKLGAILGDQVQSGCNSVTNPGALLGKKSMLLPNTTAPSGYHPPNSLIR